MNAIQHSSSSNEHYTPEDYVLAGRNTMGGIDFDPATSLEANAWIRAPYFCTYGSDVLHVPWALEGAAPLRTWLNPPGGKYLKDKTTGKWVETKPKPGKKGAGFGISSAFVWWEKLQAEWWTRRIHQAIFVGFTLEILRTSQAAALPVQCFHRCYPKDRIRFITPGGEEGDSPGHGNVIAYLPPTNEPGASSFERFAHHFHGFGLCEKGTLF